MAADACLPIASILARHAEALPGLRATDDGVKAAATDSMFAMTGVRDEYNPATNCYEPPRGFKSWGEIVNKNAL